MGYANLEELVRFREIAMGFQTRSKDKFFTDVHYTVWVKSKFDLPELDFEKYAELSDNRTEWLSNIMNEGKEKRY